MNQIATVARTQTIIWAAREFKVVTSFDEATQERYRKAALSYFHYCRLHPGENQCRAALLVGSIHFETKIAALRSEDRDSRLANIRQQLMAFSRVVSVDQPKQNSLPGIGRAFCRNHATVIYAVRKYGEAIKEALRIAS